MPQKLSLIAQARQQLKLAAAAPSGRSAKTVYGGHECTLRQTVIALTAGNELEEHNHPGDSTVHVISGHIRLRAGDVTWEGLPGDFLIVPEARHSVEAVADSAFLMTVAKEQAPADAAR